MMPSKTTTLSFAIATALAVILASCTSDSTRSDSPTTSIATQPSSGTETANAEFSSQASSASESISVETAPNTEAVGAEASAGSLDEGQEITGPVIPGPGEVSLTALRGNEVCELISIEEAVKIVGYTSEPTGPSTWSQTEEESFCDTGFVNEGDEGGELVYRFRTGTLETCCSESSKTEPAKVAGATAVLEMSEFTGIAVHVARDAKTLFSVSVKTSDKQKPIALAEAMYAKAMAFTPDPQPPIDGKVSDPLAFSMAQLCDLLDNTRVKKLVQDESGLGISTVLLQTDEISCSKGGAKLGVTIRREPSIKIIEPTKVTTKHGEVEMLTDTYDSGRKNIRLEGKVAGVYLSVSVQSVSAGSLGETTAIEEFDAVAEKLKRRLG